MIGGSVRVVGWSVQFSLHSWMQGTRSCRRIQLIPNTLLRLICRNWVIRIRTGYRAIAWQLEPGPKSRDIATIADHTMHIVAIAGPQATAGVRF